MTKESGGFGDTPFLPMGIEMAMAPLSRKPPDLFDGPHLSSRDAT